MGGFGAGLNGGQLWHAHAGDNPRRTDGARSDADLHRVRARIDQRLGRFRRRHITGNDLNGVGNLLRALNRLRHRDGVAMRGVYDHAVDARFDQRFRPLKARIADGRGRRHTQAPGRILGGVRVHGCLVHVLHGQQADTAIVIIHDDQPLDPVLVKQAASLFIRCVHLHRDDFLRHQIGDRFRHVFGKARVTIGDDAHHLARAVHHRNAGKAGALLQFVEIAQAGRRRNRHRVHHHAALILLHHRHFTGLLLDGEIAVDHADAPGLRHGNRQARLGHRVHRRRDQRDVQRNGFGQEGGNINVSGHDLAGPGLEQHVVEGDGLSDFHVGSSLFGRIRESRCFVKSLCENPCAWLQFQQLPYGQSARSVVSFICNQLLWEEASDETDRLWIEPGAWLPVIL